MKKKILAALLVVFLCPVIVFSRVISSGEALKASLRWIAIENNSQHLRLSKENFSFSGISSMIYQNEIIGYVVDLEPTGFLIIPIISELSPIKFISYRGDYDVLEQHPFIVQIKARIYYTLNKLNYFNSIPQPSSGADEDEIDSNQKKKNESIWENFLADKARILSFPVSSVPPMLSSTWGQGSPYNMYTPTVSGQHTWTGCSATAQAQVMYYWKYPTTGQGSHSYVWNSQTLSANFDHEYYWDNMLDDYSGSETSTQKDAVARLMSDVGIAINMNYGLSGSSAVINANNSLVNFFKYSTDSQRVFRSNYSSWTDWFNVFKSQMETGWPAILATFRPDHSSGHAVVIDGYRVDIAGNQVHVNMGWDGAQDNYYTLDDLYVYGDEYWDYAEINIHPPEILHRKDDLLGSWSGQGVYYRNSDTGNWSIMAAPASQVAAGDIDNDGTDDLIGIWPSEEGVWVKYSSSGTWTKLSSTADWIGSGDMNGDGRDDLIGTWPSQGVYYRNSANGAWINMASPASKLTSGDLDDDGTDDLILIWPSSGGVWIKYSSTGSWSMLSSTADWIGCGDMNGDGRDDLIGTWTNQGVFYRDSLSGFWVKMATPATQIASGDLDGDGTDDLIGIWPGQGGIWVKYSSTASWQYLSSPADWISSGKMRSAGLEIDTVLELNSPIGGFAAEPNTLSAYQDLSSRGPGGWNFSCSIEDDTASDKESAVSFKRIPGPGEPGFIFIEQDNISPRKDALEKREKRKKK